MTADQLLARVRSAAARSDLLRAVASVRSDGGLRLALGGVAVRPLSEGEVAWLEGQGNTAEDWSRVRVAEGFHPGRVRNCEFRGDVVLGRFVGMMPVRPGTELPAGVYNATVADSVIGHGALVRDVRLLAGYVVGPGAVVWDCGRVSAEPDTTFGNGAALPVGVETGGREVHAFAELDVEVAAAVVRPGRRVGLRPRYAAAVAAYAERARSPRGIIERGARVVGAQQVRNAYVGPSALVDGPTLLADSTLLSSPEEPARVESGAIVQGSLLQWGSRVSTAALVEDSILTEHSAVERQGKVTASILGPNTAVGAGEVTSCLLGPFVAAHHQSLLIATVWPEGRGNVGYGANVGSNHTSRAPDQEFWPGEGMFFGLGVNIKFPADFRAAPYTVVACGAALLPQRMAFPFSLIATPSMAPAGISPACMEIVPAWVLSDNLFALRRNEAKFRTRDRARRTRFTFDVFRPDTVDLMRDACRRLEAVPPGKDVYTDADVEGLGKNFMQERHRRQAIDVYRFFVRAYALLGLKERVQALLAEEPEKAGTLLTVPDTDPRWEHQRRLLTGELRVVDVAGGLAELPRVLEMMAREVEESKARDDRRGARIIEDYALVHTPAERDECVRQCWDQTRRLQAEVETLLARWHETIEEWGSVSRPVPSAVQREPVGGAAPLVSIALPR